MGLAINKTVDYNKKHLVWSINPEGLRFYAYLCFWVLVIIGAWLTFYHSNVQFHDNPLIHHFGYNNICILFDTYPATYVLPTLWVINFLLLVSYIITSWLRIYQKYLLSSVSKRSFFYFLFQAQLSSLVYAYSLLFFPYPLKKIYFFILHHSPVSFSRYHY